ncbi:hypothetical protein D3C85_351870 [compost metagenome]
MDLQLAPGEGGVVADDDRIGQPAGHGIRHLARQDQPVLIGGEEGLVLGEMASARRDIGVQAAELNQAEGRAHLRRLHVVADVREDELGVIGNAADIDVEAVLDGLGIVEQGRIAAPAAQQPRPVPPVVAVDAQHAAVAGAVDDVRAVEAGGADVRPGAGADPAQGGAKGVGGVLDDQKVVRLGDGGDAVPVGQVADQGRDHHGPGARRDRGLDPVDVDVEGVRLDVHEGGDQVVLHQRGDGGGEGQDRGDDLGPFGQAQQFDGQIVGAGAGVDHHPVGLVEPVGDLLLEPPDVVAHLGRTAQHRDDGGDLLLAMHGLAVGDAHGRAGRGVDLGHTALLSRGLAADCRRHGGFPLRHRSSSRFFSRRVSIGWK